MYCTSKQPSSSNLSIQQLILILTAGYKSLSCRVSFLLLLLLFSMSCLQKNPLKPLLKFRTLQNFQYKLRTAFTNTCFWSTSHTHTHTHKHTSTYTHTHTHTHTCTYTHTNPSKLKKMAFNAAPLVKCYQS